MFDQVMAQVEVLRFKVGCGGCCNMQSGDLCSRNGYVTRGYGGY